MPTLPSLLLCLASYWAAGGEDEADRARLLAGVPFLEQRGVPGTVLVFGPSAFAVLTANPRPEAVVAAARFGEGRVLAVAHEGYLAAEALARRESGASRLFHNALGWLAPRVETPRVGYIDTHRKPATLGEADVLVSLDTSDLDEETLAAIRQFVAQGGGLICAVCPWGFEQVNAARGRTLREHLPQNKVLAPMGLVFAQGYAEASEERGFAAAASRPEEAHAGRAFEDILAGKEGASSRSYLVERAIDCLPREDPLLWPRLAESLGTLDAAKAPRPSRPLGASAALDRLRVSWFSRSWRDLPPDKVLAAPGADEFPGSVPAGANRVERSLILDAATRGWQGVGLYLAAGDTLEIRADAVEGWSVRVGCHTDLLWHHEEWQRWPDVSHSVSLAAGLTRVATPFGGTIYFEADRAERAPLEARLSGAVPAPRFVLGDSAGAGRWVGERTAPAPWAELEGRNIVLSVPSPAIRGLEDPAPLIEWWDGVVRSHCDLAAVSPPACRERIVPDAQISAGYMHSGYPIMCHLDMVTPAGGALPPLLDVAALAREGNWGLLHELGHNRQRGEWSFAGTGEVTCNLFTLYTSQTMAGIEPWTHPWLEAQKPAGREHLKKGAPFADWKDHPGVALISYAQLQKEFGWGPFIQVFGEYERLAPEERPRSDQGKIDQWLCRMSRAVRHDLRPFFRAWGIPLGEEVRSDHGLDLLPEWLPDFAEL
ncbi:MAG: hypothetical protein HY812_02645 [Planctomycetes bacterium]|nr:hypothetical protein [Planctomycetota bacterium]